MGDSEEEMFRNAHVSTIIIIIIITIAMYYYYSAPGSRLTAARYGKNMVTNAFFSASTIGGFHLL